MSAGHTPGPWDLGAMENFDTGHVIRMGEAITSPWRYASHLVIEYGHGCEPGTDQYAEAEANARLIAAAPTMRDALAGVVAMGCWVPVGEGGTRCAFCNAVNDETHDDECAFVAAVNALSEADGTL